MFKDSKFPKKSKIHLFKLSVLLGLFATVINSCDKVTNNQLGSGKKDSSDAKIPEAKPPKNENIIPIDSIKMHAFDNLYFGANTGTSTRKFLIDNMEYNVKVSKGAPVYYYMLENSSTITTKKKAQRVLNDLKNIISKKHPNNTALNRTYYTRHPEEREKLKSVFEQRSFGEFDEKIVGQPYEFAANKWNLKYKTIQIGYFIENKNRTRYMEARAEDDYYTIYIELTSKLHNPKVIDNSNEQKEKDSNKF